MKFDWKNIFRVLKIMLIVFGVVFFLSACGEDNDSTTNGEGEVLASQQQRTKCFQSGIMQILYDAAGSSAMGAYDDLTKGAMVISMLGFVIWFALRMMKHISSFTEDNAGKFWTEVSRQFFLCMVCGMLASSTSVALWTLNTLVFPVFFSFLELGAEVMNLTSSESVEGGQCVGGEFMPYTKIKCSASLGDVTKEGFPAGPAEMMKCMICGVSSRLSIGFKLSEILRHQGGVLNWLMSLLLSLCFIIVRVTFVFYLVDTTFRMTMMLVLFPLLIISYAFSVTRGWATTGFKIILNVSALIMFIGVTMAMILNAVEIVIDNFDGLAVRTGEEADNTIVFLVILLLAFLVISSMEIAKTLTDGLVGGGTEASFASQGATVLAWIAKRGVNLLTIGATAGINAYIEKNEKLKKARDRIKNMRKKADMLAGRGYKGGKK